MRDQSSSAVQNALILALSYQGAYECRWTFQKQRNKKMITFISLELMGEGGRGGAVPQ